MFRADRIACWDWNRCLRSIVARIDRKRVRKKIENKVLIFLFDSDLAQSMIRGAMGDERRETSAREFEMNLRPVARIANDSLPFRLDASRQFTSQQTQQNVKIVQHEIPHDIDVRRGLAKKSFPSRVKSHGFANSFGCLSNDRVEPFDVPHVQHPMERFGLIRDQQTFLERVREGFFHKEVQARIKKVASDF